MSQSSTASKIPRLAGARPTAIVIFSNPLAQILDCKMCQNLLFYHALGIYLK
ncbi:MAG: hypothetical protein AAGA16_24000 [Cyanobacteria bacterium P01_E01_bin.35]